MPSRGARRTVLPSQGVSPGALRVVTRLGLLHVRRVILPTRCHSSDPEAGMVLGHLSTLEYGTARVQSVPTVEIGVEIRILSDYTQSRINTSFIRVQVQVFIRNRRQISFARETRGCETNVQLLVQYSRTYAAQISVTLFLCMAKA